MPIVTIGKTECPKKRQARPVSGHRPGLWGAGGLVSVRFQRSVLKVVSNLERRGKAHQDAQFTEQFGPKKKSGGFVGALRFLAIFTKFHFDRFVAGFFHRIQLGSVYPQDRRRACASCGRIREDWRELKGATRRQRRRGQSWPPLLILDSKHSLRYS